MTRPPGPGPFTEAKMDNMDTRGGAETGPSVAPQEAPALRIPGAITYDELMRKIKARNPIVTGIVASRHP